MWVAVCVCPCMHVCVHTHLCGRVHVLRTAREDQNMLQGKTWGTWVSSWCAPEPCLCPLLAEGITHTPSESGDRSCQSRTLGRTSQAREAPGVLDSAASPVQNASGKSLIPFKGGWYGLPRWLSGKEFACGARAAGDEGLLPGLGRGHGNPPQYSCLENPHGQRSLVGCHP